MKHKYKNIYHELPLNFYWSQGREMRFVASIVSMFVEAIFAKGGSGQYYCRLAICMKNKF